MKIFVLLLVTLVAFAAGGEFQEALEAKERSISSQIVDAIEAFKVQMPCGFPGLGLGPLAPARLSHRELALGGDSTGFEGAIDDFILFGLDNFDIKEFKLNAILSKVTFKFHWHKVNFESIYQMLMRMNGNAGQRVQLTRNGGAMFAVKDFQLWGTVRYSLGVISGNLRLKEFKVYASVGEVNSDIQNLSNINIINRKLNDIIEEWIMLAINDNTENMADLSNKFVVPLANQLIGDMSLGDLLGLVGGGGGGEGEPVEKEPCVPPQLF